eukprot:103291-Chlamydomonas_euryale.AAC.1
MVRCRLRCYARIANKTKQAFMTACSGCWGNKGVIFAPGRGYALKTIRGLRMRASVDRGILATCRYAWPSLLGPFRCSHCLVH